MKHLLLLAALLASGPAFAGHPWGGVDICEARRDTVPPGIEPALLPEPASEGAVLLQRYCTQCHNLPGPGRHTREEWPAVLGRMDTLMQVSRFYRGLLGPVSVPDARERALLQTYLEDNALRPLPARLAALPPGGAEQVYRTACGDCHAAPDPRAYRTDWPVLLQRMARHRETMARTPLTAAQQAAVADFVGMTQDGPTVAGTGHNGIALPLPAADAPTGDPLGRWASLAAFFGLAGLGLWRWRRSLQGIPARATLVRPWTSEH